jgi:hypothetical protein
VAILTSYYSLDYSASGQLPLSATVASTGISDRSADLRFRLLSKIAALQPKAIVEEASKIRAAANLNLNFAAAAAPKGHWLWAQLAGPIARHYATLGSVTVSVFANQRQLMKAFAVSAN